MIATWRREIPDRDFGSRIFMVGLARGIFTEDELITLPPEDIIARVQENDLESFLLAEWRSHRARAETAAAPDPQLRSDATTGRLRRSFRHDARGARVDLNQPE
jgi:hypothetical protein